MSCIICISNHFLIIENIIGDEYAGCFLLIIFIQILLLLKLVTIHLGNRQLAIGNGQWPMANKNKSKIKDPKSKII